VLNKNKPYKSTYEDYKKGIIPDDPNAAWIYDAYIEIKNMINESITPLNKFLDFFQNYEFEFRTITLSFIFNNVYTIY
jgi:hypothetical protein